MLFGTTAILARFVEEHEETLRASPEAEERQIDKLLQIANSIDEIEQSIKEQSGEDVDLREVPDDLSDPEEHGLPPGMAAGAQLMQEGLKEAFAEILSEYEEIVGEEAPTFEDED